MHNPIRLQLPQLLRQHPLTDARDLAPQRRKPVHPLIWKGFLTLRAGDRAQVETLLQQLPLADYLSFEITELAPLSLPAAAA
jgi:hypothetical protein